MNSTKEKKKKIYLFPKVKFKMTTLCSTPYGYAV